MNNASSSHDRDPIIGLDVGGHRPLFYCHVSTLTNGSPYFASRFNISSNSDSTGQDSIMQPGDHLGQDEFGRNVYFVDRNGAVFHIILEYLRNNTVKLPPFQQNPELWQILRLEAAFFGLDGLLSILQVTYTCAPLPNVPRGDRGVLYWLGTDRGRTPESYQNPYQIGAVNVKGSLDDDDDYDELTDPEVYDLYPNACTFRLHAKASLVQYRQKVETDMFSIVLSCMAMDWCGGVGGSVTVDVRDVRVRPTHYSLRYSCCAGMVSDWLFEGSINGNQWNALHEGKNDSYIHRPTLKQHRSVREQLGIQDVSAALNETHREFLTNWAEEHFRRTWQVPEPMSNTFYRFFRIRKVGEDGCLHGAGLEIFGDVNECPED